MKPAKDLAEYYQAVIDYVECHVCFSEAGYPCTYTGNIPTSDTAYARAKIAKMISTPTKRPHDYRVGLYEQHLTMARLQKVRAEERRIKEELKEERRKVREAEKELLTAYREYGLREAEQLGDWLRENWSIFRIDEKF